MKSVLVANAFVAETPADITTLTRGQLAMIDENGVKPTTASKVIQFVVGLGEGMLKRGLILAKENIKSILTAYEAPTATTIKFTGLSAVRTIGMQGFDTELVISVKPLNSFGGYPLEVFNASVTMNGTDETSDEILTRLNTELKKVVAKINTRFGAGSLSVTDIADGAVTFTGKAGFEFYVVTNGILKGTKTETRGKLGVGTYAEVEKTEKTEDVASQGYNPNYESGEKMFGDIFLADKSKTYDCITMTSMVPHTHPFHIQSEGLDVTQFIYVVAGTGTSIKTAIDALQLTE